MQVAQAVQEELDCQLDKNCKEITANASLEDIVSVSLPVGPTGERKLVDVKVAAYNDGAYTHKRNARCGYATFIEKKTRSQLRRSSCSRSARPAHGIRATTSSACAQWKSSIQTRYPTSSGIMR